jgi:3-oxoacyl-[acyl-carrier-protein] synthase II
VNDARRPVVAVVSAGLKAPGGNTIEELWTALCAGRAFAEPFVDARLPATADVLVGRVSGFEPSAYCTAVELRRLDRSHLLAIGAAQDAMNAHRGALPPPERCAVVCGVGFGATATYEHQHERLLEGGLRALSPLVIPMVMPNSIAAQLSVRLGFKGPCHTISTACASGVTAIGEAVELLRRGAADLVLAGGVDSMVTYNALCSFLRLDVMSRNIACPELASRPFDANRDGFVMAEGAGFVVLQRAEDTAAQRQAVLGHILGYASCADAHHLVAPSDNGEGARRCMELALADARLVPSDVNHINAHGTATVLNDRAEASAIADLFGDHTLPVTAAKGTTGHMIAGSGAVETIVTLWSLRAGLAPPISGLNTIDPELAIDAVCGAARRLGTGAGLTTSFGFGGSNAALVLAAA